MKFKIGDKVRVVKTKGGSANKYKHCIGKIFTITHIVKGVACPYILNEYNECGWYEDELELVSFTKSDLKDGMVVEYADGRRRMCLNDKVMGNSCYIPLINFNDDLSNNKDNDNDIVKVYNSSAYTLNDYWKDKYLTLIWERPEEEPVKKMTVAEIEKELGYKVEIVSEN